MISTNRGYMTPARGPNGGGPVKASSGRVSDPERGVRRTGERRPEEAAGTRRNGMTRYLISFDDGAMTFPEEELPDMAKAAHEVVQEAKDAGVWVSAADWKARGRASWPPTGWSPTAL